MNHLAWAKYQTSEEKVHRAVMEKEKCPPPPPSNLSKLTDNNVVPGWDGMNPVEVTIEPRGKNMP